MNDRPWDRADSRLVAVIFVAGLVVRFAYIWLLDVAPYDPWRHVQLIDNLRAGQGFTLFDGQPYLWYSPVWHRLAALLPAPLPPSLPAMLFSALAIPCFYGYLRDAENRTIAVLASMTLALCGPVVRFTVHYGPEAFALCLTLGALWLGRARLHSFAAFAAGLLYGVALIARMNFLFVAPLFVPGFRTPQRAVAFGAGALAPLALTWWRNHGIIRSHEWLFTWDGLATRTADFNPLSTLIVQLHPAVNEGLKRLHEIIVPVPEWTRSWWLIGFVVIGVVSSLAARRLWVALTVVGTMAYFLLLDDGMSSNFFRIYLVLFPAFAYGIAVCADRWKRARTAGLAVLIAFVAFGAPMFKPPQMVPRAVTSPPQDMLDDTVYLVNSGFYHPECLMARNEHRFFIGLPLFADQLEEFLAAYPHARKVLWHSFSVQDEVRDALLERPGTTVLRTETNVAGRRYSVLQLAP